MEDNDFAILWLFLPYVNINQPQGYVSSASWTLPPNLPPNCIPLGCPRAPALGSLLHASNLHWSSILHMVMYIFQCYSLKSSHPRLLPPSLFFPSVSPLLPSMLDHHYWLSKFHIFSINIQYLSFSFWLTSYCKICFNFIYLIRTDSNMFLFIAE